MSIQGRDSLKADALEANRRGALSDEQRRNFRRLSTSQRKSLLSSAALLVAGALLILFFGSSTASPAVRVLVPVVGLALAAFLLVRSISGADALTRDVRSGRVESIEGAVGRRRLAMGSSTGAGRNQFLDVGDATFRVARDTYEAAPPAGMVRVYFLPRSRRVVNFERLADVPLPEEVTAQGVLNSLKTIVHPHDRQEANDARAAMASVANAITGSFTAPAMAPSGEARDPRPLDQAILGSWTNGVLTATFSSDGLVRVRMLSHERSGRWSVDGHGRLRSDVTGQQGAADAWIAGSHLTISIDGNALTLTRKA